MNGSLFNLVKRDAKFFVTKGGYQIDIELVTPDGSKTVNITGWAVKHFGSFDSDGNQVNTANVHATVDEALLVSLGYPIRNVRGELSMKFHIVKFVDSSGVLSSNIVREIFPDENLGLILLVLGRFKSD